MRNNNSDENNAGSDSVEVVLNDGTTMKARGEEPPPEAEAGGAGVRLPPPVAEPARERPLWEPGRARRAGPRLSKRATLLGLSCVCNLACLGLMIFGILLCVEHSPGTPTYPPFMQLKACCNSVDETGGCDTYYGKADCPSFIGNSSLQYDADSETVTYTLTTDFFHKDSKYQMFLLCPDTVTSCSAQLSARLKGSSDALLPATVFTYNPDESNSAWGDESTEDVKVQGEPQNLCTASSAYITSYVKVKATESETKAKFSGRESPLENTNLIVSVANLQVQDAEGSMMLSAFGYPMKPPMLYLAPVGVPPKFGAGLALSITFGMLWLSVFMFQCIYYFDD